MFMPYKDIILFFYKFLSNGGIKNEKQQCNYDECESA